MKFRNFHFDCGDSTKGSIGFVIRIRVPMTDNFANDRRLALEKAREELRAAMTDSEYFQVINQNSDPNKAVEYCNVYINPDKIHLNCIDDWEEEEIEDEE